MTTSKETRDDAEMLALMKVARDGNLADQERCTKNNSDQATLNKKILLEQLCMLIYGMITNIIMTIVIHHNKFTQRRSQRLTKGNAVLVLDNKELSDMIANKLMLKF